MSHVPFVPASDQNMERVATALESMAGNPMIAENYDNTSTYAVGEHARHDGLLYKCITPITTAESWNASHWQEVKLADEIEDQNEKIGGTNLPTVAQTLTGAIAEQNNNIAKLEVLTISFPAFSSLPQTVSNAAIETDMVCLQSVLSNPSAQTGDWTVNTDTAGQVTVSGSISGSTTLTLYLMKSRT